MNRGILLPHALARTLLHACVMLQVVPMLSIIWLGSGYRAHVPAGVYRPTPRNRPLLLLGSEAYADPNNTCKHQIDRRERAAGHDRAVHGTSSEVGWAKAAP